MIIKSVTSCVIDVIFMYQSENQIDLMPAATFSSLTFSLWRLEEEDKHGCVFFFIVVKSFVLQIKCAVAVGSPCSPCTTPRRAQSQTFIQHFINISGSLLAFPQTNKPAAFFKFMFSSCCRGSSCVFPIKYTDVYLVNHPAGR